MFDGRRQLDGIKRHFGGKSSAELREILQAKDRDRWSDAAFAAAREVLAARQRGEAEEPGDAAPAGDLPPSGIDLPRVIIRSLSAVLGALGGYAAAGLVAQRPVFFPQWFLTAIITIGGGLLGAALGSLAWSQVKRRLFQSGAADADN